MDYLQIKSELALHRQELSRALEAGTESDLSSLRLLQGEIKGIDKAIGIINVWLQKEEGDDE